MYIDAMYVYYGHMTWVVVLMYMSRWWYVMVTFHSPMSWWYAIVICHDNTSRSYVTVICHGHMSCQYVTGKNQYIMVVYDAVGFLYQWHTVTKSFPHKNSPLIHDIQLPTNMAWSYIYVMHVIAKYHDDQCVMVNYDAEVCS